jgi:ABC-type lipoprotein export system ATPase subunit
MDFTRGSEWRKWDLHIHLPFTKLNNQYSGNTDDEIWDQFCEKLEASDVVCFGITDYFSIENFFIFKEKFYAKYPNSKKVFFPNIEFRLEVSVNRAIKEVNIHVLFSNKVEKSKIESFLSKLKTNKTRNGATIFCKDIKDDEFVGASVDYKEIPKHLKEVFGHDEPYLIVCAANNDGLRADSTSPRKMCTSDEIDKITNIFFGNTASIPYFLNEQRYEDGDKALKKAVIGGSDSHSFNDIDQFLGKRVITQEAAGETIHKDITWIKADLTFEGLRQIIFEPELRTFIGESPNILTKVLENPTKFIDKLLISHTEGYSEDQGQWFKNISIPLNHEFVAIIGNKGSGKSAIADIIGLIGDSNKIKSSASFLTPEKFKKRGLANNFQASLTWKSGDVDEKNLHVINDEAIHENVQYLPQNWFETLCNDLDGKQFNEELEKVVFTHLEESEKFAQTSFADLIQYRSQSAEIDIDHLRSELHTLNIESSKILKKIHPNYKKEIDSKLEQKQRELTAHEKIKPIEVKNPDISSDQQDATRTILAEVEKMDKDIAELQAQIILSQQSQIVFNKNIEELKRFEEEIVRIKDVINDLPTVFDYPSLFGSESTDDLISLKVKEEFITERREAFVAKLKAEKDKCLSQGDIEGDLNLSDPEKEVLISASLNIKAEKQIKDRDELKKKLNKPQEEYQKYIDAQKIWDKKYSEILGNIDEPKEDTINFYKKELIFIGNDLNGLLVGQTKQQLELAKKIYEKKNEVIKIYRVVKTKVDSIIQNNQADIEDYKIGVEAGFRFIPNFEEKLLSFINLRAKGSFMERDNAYQQLKKILEDRELKEFSEVQNIIEAINQALIKDAREDIKEEERPRFVNDQVNDTVAFYDYLFGLDYLKENYQLNLDNKNLESLSPGEKGALLLVFYLMLDQQDTPLIIDQPEDNLDNQSVSRILVRFIKSAKSRRQIIMVTHNPNLAVVADAEQVIYVQIDKGNKNKFSFEAGSIENDGINKRIVDVLEGTMLAFDKRRLRYLKKD